ncbi:hypothetical protein OPT79_80 [Klebsiella phage vB_KpnD_Opt-79]|uniref:Uncharacterized protein n=1 Tax=Escherichia phage vB_EcoD_Sadiya TaxID=2902684 RepID=A0AC61TRL5_9CAUD|nr:hypothetical protein OPT719_78 [Escherichia phage vB_EcoD_Opt-719]UGO52842.1 hypothetical protein OPT79_80 [Klebsiella phage vB_KpnD_Opt-79]UGV22590.1 hypothetical protein PHLEASOLO_80 [Escherichia phage vB_ EcoD_Phleasolo]UGV22769.1 hypothetical protein SADIYA_80 [Escherichia phage vB_EcoD_Sadiya]
MVPGWHADLDLFRGHGLTQMFNMVSIKHVDGNDRNAHRGDESR